MRNPLLLSTVACIVAICTGSWVYVHRRRRAEPFRPLSSFYQPIQYYEKTILSATHMESVLYWNDQPVQRTRKPIPCRHEHQPVICVIRLHGFFDATMQHVSIRKIRPFLRLIYAHWDIPYDTMFSLEYGNRFWSAHARVSKFDMRCRR